MATEDNLTPSYAFFFFRVFLFWGFTGLPFIIDCQRYTTEYNEFSATDSEGFREANDPINLVFGPPT